MIRGKVLAIPLNETLLYVEPIYLRAETAAYPALRMVVTMHGDDMSYAENFDEALMGLLSGQTSAAGVAREDLRAVAGRANDAFERYLKAQGDSRFEDAAAAIKELQQLLLRMVSNPAANR